MANGENPALEKKTIALKFAPAWKRIVAYLIDFALLMLIIGVMLFFALRKDVDYLQGLVRDPVEGQTVEQFVQMNSNYFDATSRFYKSNGTLFSIVTFIIQIAYFTLFWGTTGQTMGSRLMKIIVIDVTSRKVNFIQAGFRSLLMVFFSQLFYIPFIFVFNPMLKQRIHDFFTRTVVVEMPEDFYKQIEEMRKAAEAEEENSSSDF